MLSRRTLCITVLAACVSLTFGCTSFTSFSTCVGARDPDTSIFCAWCLPARGGIATCTLELNSTTVQAARCAGGYVGYTMKGSDGRSYNKSTSHDRMTAVGSELSFVNISLALRPGEKSDTFTVTLTPNPCKGVDLYYLMDVTGSMRDDQSSLKALAPDLAKTAQSLCAASTCTAAQKVGCGRIGFGTFIDKPVGPIGYWAAAQPANKVEYGDVPGLPLAPSQRSSTPFNYVFKNVFALDDASEVSTGAKLANFTSTIGNPNLIAENIDYPEAALEALVQAAVCDTEVGWRASNSVRRLIFLATDADPHIAGDGLKAGIFKPNDLTCSLRGTTEVGAGNKAIDRDYPSLGQVADVLIGRNIFPIFASPRNKVPGSQFEREAPNEIVYPSILSVLSFGSNVTLTASSDNAIDAIRQGYDQILNGVSIRVSADDVDFTITPDNAKLQWNQPTTYTITATLRSNAQRGPLRSTVATPVGFEGFGINLITQLEYEECTRSNLPNFFDMTCQNGGAVSCGRCICPSGFDGDYCECSTDRSNCLENGLECSNKGTCKCNKCICKDTEQVLVNNVFRTTSYTGERCNCTHFDCPEANGIQCSGFKCGCEGQCECPNGRTGPACECSGKSTCTTDAECVNGKCQTGIACPSFKNCECAFGYKLSANNTCTVKVYSCPFGLNGLACSGNGVDDCKTTGNCTCKGSYRTEDISDPCACNSDPNACPNKCSGHGTCNCGECQCDTNFVSYTEDPSTYDCRCSNTPCPDDCSGHGSCDCGECKCSGNYTGADCAKYCPNKYLSVGKKITKDDLGCKEDFDSECGVCVCVQNDGPTCSCSKKECPTENAKECSGHGSCKCGVCQCDAGWVGPSCGCDQSLKCPVDINGTECGGPSNGRCVMGEYDAFFQLQCGVCECAVGNRSIPLFSGASCNCSTSECTRSDEEGRPECGSQGECRCGKCVCNPGFQLDNNGVCPQRCDGSKTCPKTNGVVCNGHGTCECGACNCDSKWDGLGCEVCKDISCYDCAPYSLCSDCAQQNNFCKFCATEDANTGAIVSSKCIKANDNSTQCSVTYKDYTDCQVGSSSGGISATTKIGVGAGVGAGLACAGVAGIVGFKLVQRHLDKKEWERFEKERQRSEWKSDQNPLYQSSIRETENPLYIGRE